MTGIILGDEVQFLKVEIGMASCPLINGCTLLTLGLHLGGEISSLDLGTLETWTNCGTLERIQGISRVSIGEPSLQGAA